MSKEQEEQQKSEILDWIEAVIKEKIPRNDGFEKVLKDGVILCKLMNVINPDCPIKKINSKGGNFALMENHAAIQKSMKHYGCPEEEVFQTVDLFEARNIKGVVKSLLALGRTAKNKGFAGPTIGPKMAEANVREFDEAQQKALREGQVGLQMGSNKGASQAGINMGKKRMIND